MSQLELNQVRNSDAAASHWNGLYKVGSAAALVAVLIFRRWLGVEFLLFRRIGIIRVGPRAMPNTVLDWFMLLHAHRLIGLTLLNAFDMVNYVLVGLIFLGLYAALRRTSRSSMTLALALCFVGIAVYLASNPAFSMLTLSDQYAAATTDAQRSMLLAAGQALLALHNPNVLGQATLSFFLVTLAGLIISTAMLSSRVFSKGTAYTGILANVFGLGYPLGVALAPSTVVLALVALSLSVSACFLVIWYLLIAHRLFQLGRSGPEGRMQGEPATRRSGLNQQMR
jgi:hypothetical protein